jgi:hypothetical protein
VGDVITNGISKKNLKLRRKLGVTRSTRDADPQLFDASMDPESWNNL